MQKYLLYICGVFVFIALYSCKKDLITPINTDSSELSYKRKIEDILHTHFTSAISPAQTKKSIHLNLLLSEIRY